MQNKPISIAAAAVFVAVSYGGAAHAGVSAEEAAKLKTTLMPLGGEKAGNADGSIPAWTGGMVDPNYNGQGRRDDLFAGDKPLFSITAQNMDQYADNLSEGAKAMFKAWPDTYRMDVYKTVRSSAAPQWVYDNAYKNAVNGSLEEGSAGLMPVNVYGAPPFPIPTNGAQAIWNHLLAWRGVAWDFNFQNFLMTSDGKVVEIIDAHGELQQPYYYPDGNWETFINPTGNNGYYSYNRIVNNGPPIRAGEGIIQNINVNSDKDVAWVYLTGQRRVRKLPNACCDTPHPTAAGIMSFDEIFAFYGRISRFDWTLVGKKELYIPYNSNQTMKPPAETLLKGHHLNPDYVRWEKHRVWIVDATLKEGARHVAPKGRYYLDEDSWNVFQVDRYDPRGELAKAIWQIPFAAPDFPVLSTQTFGFYDLISKAWFIAGCYNKFDSPYPIVDRRPDTRFSPDSLAGEGLR